MSLQTYTRIVSGPVGKLLTMDVGIPERLGPAFRIALWAAAPFVFFMAAVVEGFIAGNYPVAGVCAVLFVLSVPMIVHWDQIFSHGERQRNLLTWALILGGAALLAVGIYRLAITAQSGERLYEPRRQLQEDRQGSPPAPPPPVTSSPQDERMTQLFGIGPAVEGRLTKREAETLIEALTEITDVLKAARPKFAVPPLSRDRIGPDGWDRTVSRLGFSATIDLLNQYRASVIDVQSSIDAIVTRYPSHESRLRKALGEESSLLGLSNAIQGLSSTIDQVQQSSGQASLNSTIIVLALSQSHQRMIDAQVQAIQWISLFIERRYPSVRKEIEAYL
jgi:hypothetical protein